MTLFDTGPAPVRRVSLVRLSGELARHLAQVGTVAVEGEVHKPSRGKGGRVWFTLRDRAAQITVSVPASRSRRCRTVAGERVEVVGHLEWVNQWGQLQLVADEVTPVGAGAVAAAIAEARARLAAEGLLDRPRRAVPILPAAIGVVCGNEAAVRADIESVVTARFRGYPMVFAEVTVSGPGAVDGIVRGLRELTSRPEVEVVILARGGGDAAQLLPFSDEEVCRAVCASPVPVVSAIGHEGDRPLCDEVADLRCGTPSLAAAAVVPDRSRLEAQLDALARQARTALDRRLDHAGRRLAAVDRDRAVHAGVARAEARLDRVAARMALVHPSRALASAASALEGRRRHLEALNPQRVLERGYAIVRDAGGGVVRRAGDLSPGDRVEVQLAAGRAGARIEEVEG